MEVMEVLKGNGINEQAEDIYIDWRRYVCIMYLCMSVSLYICMHVWMNVELNVEYMYVHMCKWMMCK